MPPPMRLASHPASREAFSSRCELDQTNGEYKMPTPLEAVSSQHNSQGAELSEQDFWRAIMRLQGAKRRPPARKKVAAAAEEPDDDDGE